MAGRGRSGSFSKASPQLQRQEAERDDGHLAADEKHEPLEGGIHEAIRVEADAEHVDAEPGKAGDDVAEDSHVRQAAVANHAAPPGMEDNDIPNHDDQSAVFLGVPAPEPAPGLVRPDAAENRADETE